MAIRAYRASDWSSVVGVLEATYGRTGAREDLYERWNLRCPVALSRAQVAESGERIVGVQPLLTYDWRVRGTPLQGGVLTGVAVHPDFRRRGVFRALVDACIREAWGAGADFVITMPNDRSYPGFVRMGWVDLGDRSLLVRTRLPKPANGRTPREGPVAPADLLDLAERHSRAFPGLALRKTPEWWAWRFEARPEGGYHQVFLDGPGGRLVCAAAGTLRRGPGVMLGYVVECLAESPAALVDGCGALVNRLFEEGAVAAAAVVSQPNVRDALHDAGFFRVSGMGPVKRFHTVALFRPTSDPRSIPLEAVESWDLSLGDWDNI